jgi:serine/threonine-protein kinase RsbW
MIELDADLKNLNIFIDEANKSAVALKFDDSSIMQIELALEETIVNIITHAYPDKMGKIRFECEIQDSSLVMKIVDFGIPFDILSKEDPDINAPIEERKVGGLGVFFIKKLMDNVTYERSEEGNLLTLEKIKK